MGEFKDEEEVPVLTPAQVQADIKDRRTFIGGSDAAVILNLTGWKTRFRLYQEKVGEEEPEDLSDIERIRWGVILEDVIAAEYSRRTGKKVRRVNQRQRDARHPWRVAQIDRRIVGGGILEIKTTDAMNFHEWGPEGTAEIPPAYYCQVQHQLAVMDEEVAEVAVLIGGNRLQLYVVPRDEEFIEDLTKAEAAFWRLVQTRTPPDPTSPAEAAVRWKKTIAAPVDGTAIHAALRDAGLALQAEIKVLEDRLDAVKLELQSALQDKGDSLMYGGSALVTWKTQNRTTIDTKKLKEERPEIAAQYERESPSRVFRFCKGAA
jgi:putative phage-type endonuclease